MSLRAELVRIGAHLLIKRRSRGRTVEELRQGVQAAAAWGPGLPRGIITTQLDAGGIAADRIATPVSEPDRRVVYLHGGGYIMGSPALYRHFTWRLAIAARATVTAIDYRLAPEHPFPAALEDAVTAYRWLIARGADARRIAVLGDSAGGGLAFAMMLKLRDDGLPLPAAVVALSPWTDLALSGASVRQNARADPMLSPDIAAMFASSYLGTDDPRHPYASPLYADLAGLPPTLIHVGSDEMLRDDSTRMAEKLRAAGCQVELEVWRRMPHVWHMFTPLLPEAQRAIDRIGAFLRDKV